MKTFIDIMSFHSFSAFETNIYDNPEDLEVKVSSCNFTKANAKLQKLFVFPKFTQYILSFNSFTSTSA